MSKRDIMALIEHKGLNVIMYFVVMLLLWAAAAAFYFFFLRDLSSVNEIALLFFIALVACTAGMIFLLIRVCTVNFHPAVASVFYFLGFMVMICGVIYCNFYVNNNLTTDTIIVDSGVNYNLVFSAAGFITGFCLLCMSVSITFSKASVGSAVAPLICLIIAAAYCAGIYFVSDYAVTFVANRGWDIDKFMLYYSLPVDIIAIIYLAWIVLHAVCKLIVKIGNI